MTLINGLTRRLAAGIAAITIGGSLAVAAAGTAQAAIPDHWGFAYVNNPAVPGVPVLAHQAGSWPAGVVQVKPGAIGQVFVRFPKIASSGGVVLVTAVTARPAWCQAQKWGPSGLAEEVAVRCFLAGGTPIFVPFTVLYSQSSAGPIGPGRAYGYVHFSLPHAVVARFNSAGAVNTVAAVATGVWTVRMPGLGSAAQAGNVQVTAVNAVVPAKCEIGQWHSAPGGQLIQVRCFDKLATPMNTGWTLTYQRGRAVTGKQPKRFAYTFDNKPLVPGPYAPAPAGVNFNSAGGVNNVRTAGGGLRLVTIPRVGALPDTVLVTTSGSGGRFCNLLSPWFTSPAAAVVTVRDVACYTATGALKNTAALITYTAAH
jgi:hypothetical protein